MGCGSSKTSSGFINPGKSEVVKFGYFTNLRGGKGGNVIKFLLNYCKVSYTDEGYPITDGQKEWLAYKAASDIPWCNLPYLIDGGVKMSQTLGILQYISAKWKPELLGGASP